MINTYKNNNKNLYRESFNINVDSESRAPPPKWGNKKMQMKIGVILKKKKFVLTDSFRYLFMIGKQYPLDIHLKFFILKISIKKSLCRC